MPAGSCIGIRGIVRAPRRPRGNVMRVIAFFAAISVAALWAGQSQAQDAAAGEKVFAKCKACHVVDKDQNKVGPSLKGVIGRTAGTHPNFKFSTGMIEAGKGGPSLGRCQADRIPARAPRNDQGRKDGIPRPEEGRGSRQRHCLSQAISLTENSARITGGRLAGRRVEVCLAQAALRMPFNAAGRSSRVSQTRSAPSRSTGSCV